MENNAQTNASSTTQDSSATAARYRARYHFDEQNYIEEILYAASTGAATLQAEEALNQMRRSFRDGNGYVVADMQKVRYVRVEPLTVN